MSIWKTLLWEIRIRRGIHLLKRQEAEHRLPLGVRALTPHQGWQALLEYTFVGSALVGVPPRERNHIKRLFDRQWYVVHHRNRKQKPYPRAAKRGNGSLFLAINLIIACAFAFVAYQNMSHSDLATGLLYAVGALAFLLLFALGVRQSRLTRRAKRRFL
jgi:hypothetical protein